MDISNLPSVDDVQVAVVRWLLGQGVLAGLLLSVKKVYDWYRAGADTLERAKRAAGAAVDLSSRVRKMQTYGFIAAAFSTVAMLFAQAMWLSFNFLLGNLLADAIGSKIGRAHV